MLRGIELNSDNTAVEPILRPAMPELDSIRGIAILAVVFYHEFYSIGMGTPLARWQHLLVLAFGPGRMGVNLFFVLSGFLITGILLKSRDDKNYYKRFYARRALRIFPIYFLLLIVLAALGYPRSFLLLSLLYLSNLVHLFGVPLAYNVLWSLAVEEHFYFIWPFMVRTLTRKNLEVLAIALIASSPLIRLISYRHRRCPLIRNGCITRGTIWTASQRARFSLCSFDAQIRAAKGFAVHAVWRLHLPR